VGERGGVALDDAHPTGAGDGAWTAVTSPSNVVRITAAVSVAAYVVVRWLVHLPLVDLATYRAEGLAVREGVGLYGQIGAPAHLLATYPPFAAILFVPLSYLSWAESQLLANVANVLLVALAAWQCSRLVGIDRARIVDTTIGLAAVSLWSEPVYNTLGYGQVNLVLLCLVLWDFLRPAGSKWRGVGIGIAAGIKLTPGAVIVYLLLTRRFRMALTSGLTFLLTIAMSLLVLPTSTGRYWTKLLLDTTRMGDLANGTNQSVQGMLARLTGSNEIARGWTLAAALVFVIAALSSVYVYRRLGEAWGLTVIAVGGLLASPISWSHHWVWCIPIAAVLVARKPRWLALVAVFWAWIAAVSRFPRRADDILVLPPWERALTNWYVLFGVAWVIFAVIVAHRFECDRTSRLGALEASSPQAVDGACRKGTMNNLSARTRTAEETPWPTWCIPFRKRPGSSSTGTRSTPAPCG
jgi:alpha-1,2-mannosyltransferase